MARWKTTEQLIKMEKDGEHFDENWMNFNNFWHYAPQPIPWNSKAEIRFEDVDLWEVISEESNSGGFIGVYAAYLPYEEYYVVTKKWSIWKEFVGENANKKLEDFLIKNKISYPKSNNNNNIYEILNMVK